MLSLQLDTAQSVERKVLNDRDRCASGIRRLWLDLDIGAPPEVVGCGKFGGTLPEDKLNIEEEKWFLHQRPKATRARIALAVVVIREDEGAEADPTVVSLSTWWMVFVIVLRSWLKLSN
ncbi:hypothetical protein Droror1_Dr00000233 [Drosera rotundifolia]